STKQEQQRELKDEQNRKDQVAEERKGRGPLNPEDVVKEVQEEVVDGVQEEEEEVKEEGEEVAEPESEPEGEVIEVEPSEYEHLSGLDDDSKIAFGIKHRKSAATMQSKLDKVQSVVGKDFIDATMKGDMPKEVGIIINNLADQAFQDHIADFYNTHEQRDGAYVRTVSPTPHADVLKKYSELQMSKATLSALNYMPEGEDWSRDDADLRPGSPSAIAITKFEAEKNRIETELKEIREAAVAVPDSNTQDQSGAGQLQLESLVEKYPELKDDTAQTAFKEFIEINRPNALDVFYTAFKAKGAVKKKTKRLILRELDTISNNKGKTTKPAKAKAQKESKKYDDPGIASDAEFFGDYD
ncbi:MAG: hypothetical protein KAS32_00845, partial [Candidatus Peribacteraceae bacterium]|nr:hypothetical protein [Candidatus Peribacteraceae bacterium]